MVKHALQTFVQTPNKVIISLYTLVLIKLLSHQENECFTATKRAIYSERTEYFTSF